MQTALEKDIKSVHVRENVTPVDVNANYLAFSTII